MRRDTRGSTGLWNQPGREKGRRAPECLIRKIQPWNNNRGRKTLRKSRTLPETRKIQPRDNNREENLKGRQGPPTIEKKEPECNLEQNKITMA